MNRQINQLINLAEDERNFILYIMSIPFGYYISKLILEYSLVDSRLRAIIKDYYKSLDQKLIHSNISHGRLVKFLEDETTNHKSPKNETIQRILEIILSLYKEKKSSFELDDWDIRITTEIVSEGINVNDTIKFEILGMSKALLMQKIFNKIRFLFFERGSLIDKYEAYVQIDRVVIHVKSYYQVNYEIISRSFTEIARHRDHFGAVARKHLRYFHGEKFLKREMKGSIYPLNLGLYRLFSAINSPIMETTFYLDKSGIIFDPSVYLVGIIVSVSSKVFGSTAIVNGLTHFWWFMIYELILLNIMCVVIILKDFKR